jgi:hypothetical protein
MGFAFATTTDEYGDVSRRKRVELPQPRPDPRQRLSEGVQSAARGAELVAVLVVVLLEPARADPEDEAAAADVVDGPRHVGEQIGVAVAVARDERADLDAVGRFGPGTEHRPALEVLPHRIAVQGEEVVPVEDDVDADLLRLGGSPADRAVVGVLWLELETHPEAASAGSWLVSGVL